MLALININLSAPGANHYTSRHLALFDYSYYFDSWCWKHEKFKEGKSWLGIWGRRQGRRLSCLTTWISSLSNRLRGISKEMSPLSNKIRSTFRLGKIQTTNKWWIWIRWTCWRSLERMTSQSGSRHMREGYVHTIINNTRQIWHHGFRQERPKTKKTLRIILIQSYFRKISKKISD